MVHLQLAILMSTPTWPTVLTEAINMTTAEHSRTGFGAFASSHSTWSSDKRWRYCYDLRRGRLISDHDHLITTAVFALLQLVYPDNVKLSEEDKTNLCYLAFPDSNSGCMGDTQFHVKIKCSQPLNLMQTHINYNAKCPVFLQADHSYLYGFVFFRQIKDLSLPRGYFQKVRFIIPNCSVYYNTQCFDIIILNIVMTWYSTFIYKPNYLYT